VTAGYCEVASLKLPSSAPGNYRRVGYNGTETCQNQHGQAQSRPTSWRRAYTEPTLRGAPAHMAHSDAVADLIRRVVRIRNPKCRVVGLTAVAAFVKLPPCTRSPPPRARIARFQGACVSVSIERIPPMLPDGEAGSGYWLDSKSVTRPSTPVGSTWRWSRSAS